MSKLVGIIPEMLGNREVYDDDPKLSQLMGNTNFIVIRDPDPYGADVIRNRCDYCGRKVTGDECKGCGAPVKDAPRAKRKMNWNSQ